MRLLLILFTLLILSISTLNASTVFECDFESGNCGFYPSNGIWEIGMPTSGPVDTPFLTNCAATVLDGNYPEATDSYFVSPTIKLPVINNNEEIHLIFRHWFKFASCRYCCMGTCRTLSDLGEIFISKKSPKGVWGSWKSLTKYKGYITKWSEGKVDLSEYSGSIVKIGFYLNNSHLSPSPFCSGCSSSVSAGWFVDDIKVKVSSFASILASVSPENINFGKMEIHSDSSQSFTITNNSDDKEIDIGEITITGINSSDYYIVNTNSCSGKSLLPSEKCATRVSFFPKSEGVKNTNIIISYLSDNNESTLKVPLIGVGCISDYPAIIFSEVPPYGNRLKNLKGTVEKIGAEIEKYKIVIYIYINGWWSRPYANNPITNIKNDTSWESDITTGPIDHLATQIVAFLIPTEFNPPVLEGDDAIPKKIYVKSITHTEVTRKPTEKPCIEFTYVPPIGSFENLKGKVCNVIPKDCKVAVYIKVTGRWWNKPSWETPSTTIKEDNTWSCDITTGGIDEEATLIKAFLILRNYEPPLRHGQLSLPQIDSVSEVEFMRLTSEKKPSIEFTYVPPIGSHKNLKGKVSNVVPKDYKVAVYIKVLGGWWTKPKWTKPSTSIESDNTWVCDITTGGIDEKATKIKAFLIKKDYNPPSRSGQGALPTIDSVAEIEVVR